MNGIEWLLDTNIVVGLLKGQATAVALAEAQNLELARAAVSQITRMELLGFPGLSDEEEVASVILCNAAASFSFILSA